MVVMKKIQASTLMETLVASVLIVIIFMISSMIMNNLFGNRIKYQSRMIDTRFTEIHYLALHHQIELPLIETVGVWQIQAIRRSSSLYIEANNSDLKKEINKEYVLE